MTEQLTARLASLGSWRVASPAAALRYRGTRKPIAQIATELGVDAVLEGSVARHGSSVSVAARLVDARTGRRIWGDAYEQGIDNVLVAQNDLVRAIARETDLRLAPDVSTRLSSTPRTVAPAAYDAYVRGRHAWDKRSESALHDAIRFFQDSIDADPTYAPAYAGLADAYAQLGYGSYVSPEDTFPRARSAAEKALTLDPSLAEGHASRGYALMYYDWDFAAAESEHRRAIRYGPITVPEPNCMPGESLAQQPSSAASLDQCDASPFERASPSASDSPQVPPTPADAHRLRTPFPRDTGGRTRQDLRARSVGF